MPASPSRDPSTEDAHRPFGAVIVLALIIALGLICAALPASIAARFMPKSIQAGDFSGTLWHGSVGHLTINNRRAGAIEWRLHPLALLRGRVSVDLRWVKGAFALDGRLILGHSGFDARSLHGGGSLNDLGELNPAPGWQADIDLAIDRIAASNDRFDVARGIIHLAHVNFAQLSGEALGSYVLSFGDDAVRSDGSAVAQVRDESGPLEIRATLTLQPAQRIATLSGTVKERGEIAPVLRHDLDALAQMRGRDRDGRIPLDFELAL